MASNDQKMNFSSNTEVDPQNRSDDETKGEEQPVNTKDAPLVEASTETTRENEPSNVKKGDSKSEGQDSQKRTSVFQGCALYEYEWKPEGDIKAVVHICHGIHEYMGRYELLAKHLKDNGLLVRGFDLVGHGRSEGDRGHVDSIESYVTDVVNHMKDTKTEFSELPLFLLGHSNGGVVAAGVTFRIQDILQGVVFSAAALDSNASPILKLAAKIIAFFAPQTGVVTIDENSISSVEEEIEAYNNDPFLYRGKPKASWATAMVQATDVYRPRLHEISLPILIIHGTDDSLVPISASNILFNNATSSDKIFERFEGSRHEILHDKDQDRARELICRWLLARLNGPVVNIDTEPEVGLEPKENSENNNIAETPQSLEEKEENSSELKNHDEN